MFGNDQPLILQLLELPMAENLLKGLVLELEDCSFPLVVEIIATTNQEEAFMNADAAILVGAKPRLKGMERRDLLIDNGKIFK